MIDHARKPAKTMADLQALQNLYVPLLGGVATLLASGVLEKEKRTRRKRRWWVRPYLRRRNEASTYTSLYRELIQVCDILPCISH